MKATIVKKAKESLIIYGIDVFDSGKKIKKHQVIGNGRLGFFSEDDENKPINVSDDELIELAEQYTNFKK
jgi:hypothetical protein